MKNQLLLVFGIDPLWYVIIVSFKTTTACLFVVVVVVVFFSPPISCLSPRFDVAEAMVEWNLSPPSRRLGCPTCSPYAHVSPLLVSVPY